MSVIDINSKGEYPSNVLSNSYPNAFVLDGVKCACMESFLQSLKFRTAFRKRRICALTAEKAKKKGSRKNFWKYWNILHWQGRPINRLSESYRILLFRAYNALNENEAFRQALKDAGDAELTHTVGRTITTETMLTQKEFIEQLNRLRNLNKREEGL